MGLGTPVEVLHYSLGQAKRWARFRVAGPGISPAIIATCLAHNQESEWHAIGHAVREVYLQVLRDAKLGRLG